MTEVWTEDRITPISGVQYLVARMEVDTQWKWTISPYVESSIEIYFKLFQISNSFRIRNKIKSMSVGPCCHQTPGGTLAPEI